MSADPTRYPLPSARSEPADGGRSLENVLLGKVRCLSDIIADVDRDIETREAVSGKVTARIYEHYLYLKSKLIEIYYVPAGRYVSLEKRRSSLEKQLDILLQEKRAEDVERWKDVAKLKVERRTWLKQYHDLLLRVILLAPMGSAGKNADRSSHRSGV